MDDYKPTLVYMEDFQLDLEEILHENVQNTIDVPLKGNKFMKVGSLFAPKNMTT